MGSKPLHISKLHMGKHTGPWVIKLFSCSTQLNTKVQLLIKTKIPTNEEVSCRSLSDVVFIMLINVKMMLAFNMYEQDKLRAHLG